LPRDLLLTQKKGIITAAKMAAARRSFAAALNEVKGLGSASSFAALRTAQKERLFASGSE
jgi:hypothetical protein